MKWMMCESHFPEVFFYDWRTGLSCFARGVWRRASQTPWGTPNPPLVYLCGKGNINASGVAEMSQFSEALQCKDGRLCRCSQC